ncbi:MAG: proteasome subunit beta [Streptosporangiales bacterium]|nr:proteasome subunit beta [Streptosporangiales bacterium]
MSFRARTSGHGQEGVALSSPLDGLGRLPSEYMTPGIASISDFLGRFHPELLPGSQELPGPVGATDVKHGTTIVAATHAGGVVMAGDRRATMGNVIAQRNIVKVFRADDYSCVGMAGTAGVGTELIRLFQLEMEHYEKIEGVTLSLDGKTNRLSTMIRSNLSMAMQGLAVVPLFAGYDLDTGDGRIFSYDITGSRSEEQGFHAVGSGSVFARGAMKKLYRPDAAEEDTVLALLHALYDAADDDSASGQPDLARRIFPTVVSVTSDRFRQYDDDEVGALVEGIIAGRTRNPDGPVAPVRDE